MTLASARIPAALVLLVACGGPPAESAAVATAPWTTLGLPAEGASRIVWSDAEVLTVDHPPGDPGALTAHYAAALEAGGYRRTVDIGRAPFVAQRWAAPDGTATDLAITPRSDGWTVHLTSVPGVVP